MDNEQEQRFDIQSDRQLLSVSPKSTSEVAIQSSIIEYYHLIIRHKLLIATIAGSCACAGALFNLRTEPVYRTQISLDIQGLNADVQNTYLVDTENTIPSDVFIQTQIKLLKSELLLGRVKVRLVAEQHPAFLPRIDLLSRVQRVSHLGYPSDISYKDLLDKTADSVRIKPLGIPQLIEITCDSWDAAFAVHFCNTLTSELQAANLESQGGRAKGTNGWLIRQAGDVRQKAEDSKQKLIAATGGNGLMLNPESTGVEEDGLRQLQSELVHAQVARMEKEEELATAQRSPDRGLGTDASEYAANKVRLADLQNKLAAFVPPLKEANPKVIYLRSEIRRVQENLQSERQESEARLRSEFTAAKHHEDLLVMSYHVREGHVSSGLQKNSQVVILRHEMQTEQQLYQTLLQRAKDAGFTSALQTSTIRTVSAAKVPRFPFYPQRLAAVVAGFTLGGFAGFLIVLFRKKNTLIHQPAGDSERFVHGNELGVIPSPRGVLDLLYTGRSTDKSDLSTSSSVDNAHQSLCSAGWSEQLSLVAEAYRNTSLSIMLDGHSQRTKTYVIFSPSVGEEKTTVVSNLGVTLSKARQRVVLIDSDLSKPNLHRVFSLPNHVGLQQVLLGDVLSTDNSLAQVCQATVFENLFVIPAGSAQNIAIELLHFSEFNRLIDVLADLFDVILVDIPSLLTMVDVRIFASHLQGAILVFSSGLATHKDEFMARATLERDRIRVISCILSDFDPKSGGKNGYCGSYAAYQRQSELEGHVAVRQ